MTDNHRVIGRITKVSDKGWGFIISRDVPFTRIFFHWTSLEQNTLSFPELRTGMKVEFKPFNTENNGWHARQIRILIDESNSEPNNSDTMSSLSE